MTTSAETAPVARTRLGLLEAFAYVGALLAGAGGVALIYSTDSFGANTVAWWARALLVAAYLVAGAIVVAVLSGRERSAPRDRGMAAACIAIALSAGVVLAQVLGGSGALSGSTLNPVAAGGLLTALILIGALARWRNIVLVAGVIAADLIAVVYAAQGVGAQSTSTQTELLVLMAGGAALLLVVSLLPSLHGSGHAELLRFAGGAGFVLGVAQIESQSAQGGAPAVWPAWVALAVGLVFLLAGTTRPFASRGLAAAGILGTFGGVVLVAQASLSGAAIAILIFVVGLLVCVAASILIAVRTRPAQMPAPLQPAMPAPGTVTAVTPQPLPSDLSLASREPAAPLAAAPDAVTEPLPADAEEKPEVAEAPVEQPPAGVAPAAEPDAEDAGTPPPPQSPPEAPVDTTEQLALHPSEEPTAPEPAAAADVAMATPHAGAHISDDRHYWWDAAANTWKRVPVSDDGFYYYDGSAWQPRPR